MSHDSPLSRSYSIRMYVHMYLEQNDLGLRKRDGVSSIGIRVRILLIERKKK